MRSRLWAGWCSGGYTELSLAVSFVLCISKTLVCCDGRCENVREKFGGNKVLHSQSLEIISNVCRFMKQEAENGGAINLTKVRTRVAHATGVSVSSIKRILNEEKECLQSGCWYKGRYYNLGQEVKINCNYCKCQEMGRNMEIMCEQDQCIIDLDIQLLINRDRSNGWRAGNYSEFWGHKLENGLAKRLGTLHSKRKVYMMKTVNMHPDTTNLPTSYDLRTKWRGYITPPLDQGWCGASWVMSTVGVVNDRLAILSNGEDKTRLSPQHLLSCNSRNQRGCSGGHLTRAWKFIQMFGLVPEECYPWKGGVLEQCPIPKNRKKDHFKSRCVSGKPQMVLHRSSPVYRIGTEGGIMKEIMTSGSVQATMKVYHDFFMYQSGIYRCSKISSARRTSYHSVRIVGWGEERQLRRNVKYWIVANSWGEWWGENGYFRILRGTNECEIENFIIGAWINPLSRNQNPFEIYIPNRNNQISNKIPGN